MTSNFKNLFIKIFSISLCFVFIQGCQTYKAATIEEIEEGKNYTVLLNNRQEIEMHCLKVYEDRITCKINGNVMELQKANIASLKRQKISILKLSSGIVLGAAVVYVILSNGKKGSGIIRDIN